MLLFPDYTQEKIDTLFDFASNKSTHGTDGEKGTGLGLVLCKEFAQIMGGDLIVESKKNKGTTIKLLIGT